MVIFAVATGLRPSELFGLEQRDVDRQLGVVYIRPPTPTAAFLSPHPTTKEDD